MKELDLADLLREIDERGGFENPTYTKYTTDQFCSYFKEVALSSEGSVNEMIAEAILFGIKDMPLHKDPDFCLRLLSEVNWVMRAGLIRYQNVFFEMDVINAWFDQNQSLEKLEQVQWDMLKWELAEKHPDFLPTEEQKAKLGFFFTRPETLPLREHWEALKLKREYTSECEVKKIKRTL